ncbi:hypothetical protein [Aquimarina longa]|uniref:hypothetical protein n=1 Tax=Aquimarina longa TaxID=1080221 RepID=UPI00078181CA|nr:hypothetical protein [Aquimarina longa]
MNDKKKNVNYSDLQKGIDELISKFGISKTTQIIEKLSGKGTFRNESQDVKKLISFIISKSKQLYEHETNYSRMAAYHLIKKYTNRSYKQLGKDFEQSKRAAIYHHNKCEELLSIPKFHKNFTEIYKNLEDAIIQFIAKN